MEKNQSEYLKNTQYKDSSNLSDRLNLHAKYSTNPQGWHRWAFEQMSFPENGSILELGSGAGAFWKDNQERLPQGGRIILSDFSAGMVNELRDKFGTERFEYEIIDAQHIPYADASFDRVIANHMLYHVPDIDKTIAEIRRVLKPQGRLYAATNGDSHMKEVNEMLKSLLDEFSLDTLAFTLENGRSYLEKEFNNIELRAYVDSLIVTSADDLYDYIHSMPSVLKIWNDDLGKAIKEKINNMFSKNNKQIIQKDVGFFIAE